MRKFAECFKIEGKKSVRSPNISYIYKRVQQTHIKYFIFFIYLRDRRQRQVMNEFPSAGSNACNGWYWAEAKASWQEHNPSLPCGSQEPNQLRHHCCLPGTGLAGGWNQEPEPGTLIWDLGVFTGILTTRLNTHCCFIYIYFFKLNFLFVLGQACKKEKKVTK